MLKKQIGLLFLITLYCHLLFGQTPVQLNSYKALIRHAEGSIRKKDHQTALAKYEEAFQIIPNNRIDLYNAACCASLLNDFDKTNAYLTSSIENGYLDEKWMHEDADFAGFKNTPYWAEVTRLIAGKVKEIEADFDKIKNYALTALIPYQAMDKWGYLDKQTLKIVVPANYYKVGFGGNCLKVEVAANNSVNIDATGKLSVYRPTASSFPPPPPPLAESNQYAKVDSTAGFKGFRVNSKGYITHVSAIYDGPDYFSIAGDDETPAVAIYGPYKISEKWYAMVKKEGKYGLIDETGNPHPKLGFKFSDLISFGAEEKNPSKWFYFEDPSGGKGIISVAGEIKFFNEFDAYPGVYGNSKNYLLAKKGAFNGIIDLSKMEWIILPTEGRITAIDFTHNMDCNIPYSFHTISANNRIEHFFLMNPAQGGALYYIGQDGKVYKPK